MATSWNFGGLSLPEVVRRTIREAWKDEVFGQAGRMAFYHFLAIFPILFACIAVLMRAPHLREALAHSIHDVSNHVLPDRLLNMLQMVVNEQKDRAHASFPLFTVGIGVLWTSFNATWALIYGLNNAYETSEDRPIPELAITIAGLSLSLAVTAAISLFLIFGARYLQRVLAVGTVPLHLAEWAILIVSLSFSLAILYRFGPNDRNREWQWSTPGAVCALIVWIAATFGARIYFNHVNDYSRTYGHLNGVVILLLWLYMANGAILIGGEMNSEIEKAAKERSHKRSHRRGTG